MKSIRLFIALIFLTVVYAKSKGFGPGEQDYGYVTVRTGAHMFWWLYHTTADVSDSAERPLILWLAGGPGGSSCGVGNFLLVGPLDENMNERENSWVKDYNVLFVDNPVGAGFSFVENTQYFAKDNAQIARDLLEVMKSVYIQLPKFKTTPLYLYGISYGGKMAVDFVKLLHDEIQLGNIEANIKGVSMGNAWISPIDATTTYAPFLYEVSLIDEIGEAYLNNQAAYVKELYDGKFYYHATLEWFRMMDLIYYFADGVDIYNILTKMPQPVIRNNASFNVHSEFWVNKLTYGKHYSKEAYSFDQFMNGPVKEALGIPSYVMWGYQAGEIMNNLFPDFMISVTDSVEYLLNNTDIEVHVCNGNMDVIVDTPGVMKWINELKWPNSEQFKTAARTTIWVDNVMEGYQKEGGNLFFYWINVAGHDAISENPAATGFFIKSVTGV